MGLVPIEEADKNWKDSIAAAVFLNHFFAMALHIHNSEDKYDLKNIKYFHQIQRSQTCDFDRVKKVLWNSWSTEYALRVTGIQDVNDFYRYSIHWNFPQAYYSVYLNMHAFYIAKGIQDRSHDQLLKAFSKHIVSNQYPKCISFYRTGSLSREETINLNSSEQKNSLKGIHSKGNAEAQISIFLKSTRQRLAEDKKQKWQTSSRPILNKSGTPLKSFKQEHWDKVYESLHDTTILDLLYRLRIKSNYEDIQTFINADIDFKKLHKSICYIVEYINFVHEAYLAKCIGYKKFSELVNEFPCHFKTNIIKDRFENKILPILK